MARVIMITSGKGGVGKTVVTANLGSSLALLGKRVCLIDADFGLTNLDIALGLTNRIIYDIYDYAQGKCHLEDVIYTDKRLANLSMIPGSTRGTHETLSIDFEDIIKQLSPKYDFILIDSPAGIESGFIKGLAVADEAIIVTAPFHASVYDADRVIGLIEENYPLKTHLIINMFNQDNAMLHNMINILKIDLLGIIHNDYDITTSIQTGLPVALNPDNEIGLQFRQIARSLMNNTVMRIDEKNTKANRFQNKWKSFKRLLQKHTAI